MQALKGTKDINVGLNILFDDELTSANISFIPVFSIWSVVSVLALITVDAFGVVTTILTDTSTFIDSVDIQRFSFQVNFFRVDALVGVTMTVARLALEWPGVGVLSPFLLLESRTTLLTLNSAGVVLT